MTEEAAGRGPMPGDPSPIDRDVAVLATIAAVHGLRIAVVESLTSGRIAHTVGAGEGASAWFAGGVVAYLTEIKERVLGVPAGVDPCSASSAEHLARGGRELFDADVCVSATGVGGPDAAGGHAPGTVFLGWSTRTGAGHRPLRLDGPPDTVLDGTVSAAVRLLVARAEDLTAAHQIAPDAHEPSSH